MFGNNNWFTFYTHYRDKEVSGFLHIFCNPQNKKEEAFSELYIHYICYYFDENM